MNATWRILEGDAGDVLRGLPERSVHTVVTSPPYYGLRDYDVPGQIGLEATPDEYVAALVAVFREVRRVLRDDGTVWLNLGDSYAAAGTTRWPNTTDGYGNGYGKHGAWHGGEHVRAQGGQGVKPKDLIGAPWLVAFALRQPYYAGKITNELDRVWLAAMIDAEGCIYVHRRPEGASNGQGYVRKADSFGSGLEVANTNLRVVERCMEIVGRGSISRQDKDRRQPLYRWCLRTNECRDLLREVYPYLVAKQHEARLACGVPSSGERATAAWEALKILHGGGLTDVDFKAPESLHTPGWYLRSDVIWSKLNPMPESVTDRPTRAHEYVFLLSKSARYFYDADAIREAPAPTTIADARIPFSRPGNGNQGDVFAEAGHPVPTPEAGRNKRSVWTVATQGYVGAHFATFPPKLIEPCILAGAPERACGECGAPWTRVVEHIPAPGAAMRPKDPRKFLGAGSKSTLGGSNSHDGAVRNGANRTVGWEPSCEHGDGSAAGVVLDPFAGAGTTGVVALRHGRSFLGVELNADYAEMARERIRDDQPLFNYLSEAA